MKLTKKIGEWVFEIKMVQARRVGLDGGFGDDFDAVTQIHQVNQEAHFEALLTSEEFTRCDYKAFEQFCDTMELEPKFKRARHVELIK